MSETYQYAEHHTVDKSKCPYYDSEIGCCRKSEVPKSEWIPVSERLPEDARNVLVTVENKASGGKDFVYLDFYVPGNGWNNFNYHPVAAWMPLPEPWKGDEE